MWHNVIELGPEETGIGFDNEWVPPHIRNDADHILREKQFLDKVKNCGITRKELAAQGCPTSPTSYADLPPITGAGYTLFLIMRYLIFFNIAYFFVLINAYISLCTSQLLAVKTKQ